MRGTRGVIASLAGAWLILWPAVFETQAALALGTGVYTVGVAAALAAYQAHRL